MNAVSLTDLNIQQAEGKKGREEEEEDCHIHSAGIFKETCLANEKSECMVLSPRGDDIREKTFCFN